MMLFLPILIVHDGRSHADEALILDFACMDDGSMSHGHVISNGDSVIVCQMED